MFVVFVASAADICDLKMIKDVVDAKLLVTATGQRYGKKGHDAQAARVAQQNGRHVSPKAQDDSTMSFRHPVSDVVVTNARSTQRTKGPNIASGFKSPSASDKSASRSLNCKKSQNVVAVESRSSPYKKQVNGCVQNRHANGISRVKGYDASRASGCSPNDLTACVQTLTVSDEMAKTADCYSENSQRNVLRKRTASGMVSAEQACYCILEKFMANSSKHDSAYLNTP